MIRLHTRQLCHAFLLALGLLALQPRAQAQNYPSKPVTILVACAPGEFNYGSVGAGRPRHLSAVAESGLSGFSHSLWGGLFAPSGTPQSIIDSVNAQVNAALAAPDLKSKLEGDNMAVPRNSPAEFAAFVSAEAQKFEKLAREANLRAAP